MKKEGERMTELILVRHCQAEGNLKRFFQGRTDSDITELGAKQIERAGEYLKDQNIDVFYVSPLLRAKKTAEGINRYHQKEMRFCDELVEIDAGKWEGVPLSEVEKIYPEEYDHWKNNKALFHAPGGESMADVYARVSKALDRIIKDNRGKTVCLVSHGCAIMNMLCYLHGYPVEDIGKITLGTNLAISVIHFDEALRPTVIKENDAAYLQGLRSRSTGIV